MRREKEHRKKVILSYLSKFKPDFDQSIGVYPPTLTTNGISDFTGIGMTTVHKDLRDLVEEGLVEYRTGYVSGLKRNKRRVYRLKRDYHK